MGRTLSERLKPISLAEIRNLPPPTWLIDGHLPNDTFNVLFGRPGSLKSFIALDWSLSVAAGRDWFKWGVDQGTVLYIFAEGTHGLKQRVEAWHMARGLEWASPFYAIPCPVKLDKPDEFGVFIRTTKRTIPIPRMVIIDTVARNNLMAESSTEGMAAFIEACDNLRGEFPGAVVLCVHHTGKSIDRGPRGPNALEGASDSMFKTQFLQKHATPKRVELVCDRMKDAEPPATRVWEFPKVGPSLVMSWCERTPEPEDEVDKPKRKASSADGSSDKCWKVLMAQQGGATYTEWFELMDEMPKSTFKKARSKLLSDGNVEEIDGRYFAK